MEILNLDKLQAKLDKIAELNITQALDRACLLVENQAKENCPVDKGQLRQSITHNVEGNSGYVGTNVEYAPYVEFGTGIFASKGDGRQDRWSYQDAEGEWHSTIGQKPQPFLYPAFEFKRAEIIEQFNNSVQESLKDV